MAFDMISRPFWRLPALVDDDDENWSVSPWSQASTAISISEDDKHVFVSVSVPGLDEKDIEVTFDKGVLWVKGERKEEEDDKKRKYYRRASSSFSYRVAVPGELDLTKEPDATYKNGVMSVSFTKSPIAQPKKISVKTSK